MKGVIVVLSVLFYVTLVLSHGNHHGNNHHNVGGEKSSNIHVQNDMCKYTSHNGEQFNLHLFEGSYGQLQFYDQSNTKSTVYVQVCGALPSDSTWGCGANSSVCVVSNAMKGTSFGSITNVQRADVNVNSNNGKSHSGVELMFGNGELCNNGIARKAVVTYICNMDVADTAYSYPKVTGTIDECSVSITVESPLACPVANYCRSITDDETCKLQSPICSWGFGRCSASGGCFGDNLELNAGIISFIIVTSVGLCLICVCGICICACRKRCKKSCPAKKRAVVAKKSSSGKGKKRSASKQPKPEANFDHLPVYQLVPGSTPINPYTMENIQGYYMMPHQDENNNL